jgi:hypothetical protein
MLEFSEKPLARATAMASAGGIPGADGRDRSVAGWREQAPRSRAYLGIFRRVRRCPSDSWHEPVIRRPTPPPGCRIMKEARA